jgi:glycine cleavage system aminomethyltransferase T
VSTLVRTSVRGTGGAAWRRRPHEERDASMSDRINPNPGILLYTRIRKSPYYYGSRRHGVALYSVYNHHYHPRHYGDPIAEYWQLLEGVTVWDVGGAERQVEITGPDAFEFTNLLTPRNLARCEVGQCKYAFITDERGGIINDPVLLRLGENHFWLSLADSDVLLWCKGVAYSLGLDVQIREPDVGPMQIQGPRSKEVMTDLFGADILDVPYYFMVERELDGMQLVVSRTGYSGELGYELYLRNASRDGLKLWDAVIQAGEPHGLSPIGPCHIRRIEGGILAHGCDMTIDENPYEVGYGYKWMVELEQEQDFIGRDALRRVAEEGVSRKLVGVEIGGESLGAYNDGSMPDFFAVRKDGREVGKVTSACWSPRLEKNIGFAMVPTDLGEIGTELEVQRPEGTVDAVVADRVFFRPEHAEQQFTAAGRDSAAR